MKEYLLLLRGGNPMKGKSESENQAELQAWGLYMGGLAEKGKLVGGAPLISGGSVISAAGTLPEAVTSATEGIVGGYLIVKAEDPRQAGNIAGSCPHIANEGNIEIREIAPMPGA